jgi:hypothetical protein
MEVMMVACWNIWIIRNEKILEAKGSPSLSGEASSSMISLYCNIGLKTNIEIVFFLG